MIADFETTVLYVADTLKTKYRDFFDALTAELAHQQVIVNQIPGTRDIWCRDYMPIQVAGEDFLSFVYNPDYLQTQSGLNTISNISAIWSNVGLAARNSDLVIDGGNIVKWKDKVILTAKIFRENDDYDRNELIGKMHELLQVENVIIIPAAKHDFTGHADGMVRFIDETTVLLNDYSKDRRFNQLVQSELVTAGLDIVILPYNPYKNRNNTQAQGIYVNYLQMKQGLCVPVYGQAEDENAFRIISDAFRGNSIIALDCNAFANKGGVLNCVTWTISV